MKEKFNHGVRSRSTEGKRDSELAAAFGEEEGRKGSMNGHGAAESQMTKFE